MQVVADLVLGITDLPLASPVAGRRGHWCASIQAPVEVGLWSARCGGVAVGGGASACQRCPVVVLQHGGGLLWGWPFGVVGSSSSNGLVLGDMRWIVLLQFGFSGGCGFGRKSCPPLSELAMAALFAPYPP